jgi:hypothetical protein
MPSRFQSRRERFQVPTYAPVAEGSAVGRLAGLESQSAEAFPSVDWIAFKTGAILEHQLQGHSVIGK